MKNVGRGMWRRPVGRWPSLRWGFGLLLPVALLLWAISLVVAPDDPKLLTIRVESQVTSGRLAGASVRVCDIRYVADEQGEIRIKPLPAGTTIKAFAEGHESMQREIPEPGDGELILSLSGVLVIGKLFDGISEQPVEGAEVTVVTTDGEPVASSHTDEYGNFIFKFIPENADLVVRDDIYGESARPIRSSRELLIELDPPSVTGRVVDASGLPVAGVEVRGPATSVQTDEEGRFDLSGVGQGQEIVLSSIDSQSTVSVEGRDLGDITIVAGADVSSTPNGDEGR